VSHFIVVWNNFEAKHEFNQKFNQYNFFRTSPKKYTKFWKFRRNFTGKRKPCGSGTDTGGDGGGKLVHFDGPLSFTATAEILGKSTYGTVSKLKKANTKTDIYSLGVWLASRPGTRPTASTCRSGWRSGPTRCSTWSSWRTRPRDQRPARGAGEGAQTGTALRRSLATSGAEAQHLAQQVLRQFEQIKPSIAVSAASSFTGEPSHILPRQLPVSRTRQNLQLQSSRDCPLQSLHCRLKFTVLSYFRFLIK